MTKLEGEAPLPKTEVHSSLKKEWLQVVRWWRRSMGCLGLSWSSNVEQVESHLPGTSELWEMNRQAYSGVRAPLWVWDLNVQYPCTESHVKVTSGPSLRQPTSGMWLGKCATSCVPHMSALLINMQQEQEQTQHCTLNQEETPSSCSALYCWDAACAH